jgi:hypothetical protein
MKPAETKMMMELQMCDLVQLERESLFPVPDKSA